MANYPNPYAGDPAIAAITSNLVRAFVDKDPGRTRLQRLQGDKLQTESDRRRSVADAFRSFNGRAPTPAEYARITGDAIEGGMDKGIWDHNRGYTAMTAAPGDTDRVYRSVVASGQLPTQNQGVTLQHQDQIISRDEKNKIQRSQISAGPGYASVAEQRRNNDQRLAFERDKFDRTGQSDVGKLGFDENNPNLTEDQRKNLREARERKARGTDPLMTVAPGNVVIDKNNPGGGPVFTAPPAADKTSPGSQTAIDNIEYDVVNQLGLLKPGGTVGDPYSDDALRLFGAEKLSRAKSALVEAYRATRDSAAAGRAFHEALGVPLGAKWVSRGWLNPKDSRLEKDGAPVQPRTVRDAMQDALPRVQSPARTGAPPAASADAGAPPIEKLKPGVVTRFGNGQEWTIGPDGKQQRVK